MKKLLTEWRKYLKEDKDNKVANFFGDLGYKGKEAIYEFDGGCQVKLILVRSGDGVELNLIEVLSDECLNKGYASKVMKKVIEAADRHEVALYLQATPIDGKIGQEDLLLWYEKYGFEAEEEDYSRFELIRFPSGSNLGNQNK